MDKSPAFQFYPKDFLSDQNVSLMTREAVGCYIILICQTWIHGHIPDDPKKLALLCGVSSKKLALLWPQIRPCFMEDVVGGEVTGKLMRHPRLDKEREIQKENRQKRVDAGRKGGNQKASNAKVLLDVCYKKNVAKPSSSSSTASATAITTPAKAVVVETPVPEKGDDGIRMNLTDEARDALSGLTGMSDIAVDAELSMIAQGERQIRPLPTWPDISLGIADMGKMDVRLSCSALRKFTQKAVYANQPEVQDEADRILEDIRRKGSILTASEEHNAKT